MEWDKRYRTLKEGEIIQDGDEVDCCRDGWRDEPVWKPATCIGQLAPDSRFPSHRVYRRYRRLNKKISGSVSLSAGMTGYNSHGI